MGHSRWSWARGAWGAPRLRGGLLAGTALVPAAAVAAGAAGGLLDPLPLLNPALAVAVEVLAGIALAAAWWQPDRRWRARTLPVLLGCVALLVGALAVTLRVTGTVTDRYPPTFALWFAAAFAAIGGLPAVLRRPGTARRAAALLAVPLTLAGGLLLIDDEYGVWPTVADLAGRAAAVAPPRLRLTPYPSGVRPGKGVLVGLDVPATVSHFAHRPGSVYLPPAYFTRARSTLPVLVMLGGVPGWPAQWPTAGRAVAIADGYAAAHDGFAPVLVFVDQNGATTRDTECVDGPQGNAETFLSVDVPAFVTGTLRVGHAASRWGVVGFSEGGTCALDLALVHPDVYHEVVDLGGDARPTLGGPARTLSALYGGSAAAEQAHDPVHLLATRRYTGVSAWFAAGEADPRKAVVARALAADAARAGITEHEFVGVGGHNWQFASAAFARILPELCQQAASAA
jgi:S-formylglutathione hydrolase FrmB